MAKDKPTRKPQTDDYLSEDLEEEEQTTRKKVKPNNEKRTITSFNRLSIKTMKDMNS